MVNEKIISKIKGAITDAAHIDMVKTPIGFSCEDGKLVMAGTVDSISIKRKAFLAAAGICPGVMDRLNVKPASRMEDLEIADHMQNILDQEYTLEGLPIEVRVGEGIVYLDGKVPSLVHKRLPEVLAWWIPGSINIVNNIKLVPPEKDSDDEIKDIVKLVFERDKLVKDGNIVVKVKDSVVTLSGIVKSTAAIDAAEDDVWYVSGVNNVINQLKLEK